MDAPLHPENYLTDVARVAQAYKGETLLLMHPPPKSDKPPSRMVSKEDEGWGCFTDTVIDHRADGLHSQGKWFDRIESIANNAVYSAQTRRETFA